MNMFWNKRQTAIQETQIEWREKPGCFERHLQRRYRNPLFPVDRRIISSNELNEARKKDEVNFKEFIKKYSFWFSSVNSLNQGSTIDDLQLGLQDTQRLAELAFAIDSDLENEISVLEATEQKLMLWMSAQAPQATELLERAHSLSVTQRIPYFAQAALKDGPILKNEELASLLSEDLATIQVAGMFSRSFSSDYRPNRADVRRLLEEAVMSGLDGVYAKEVENAFNYND